MTPQARVQAAIEVLDLIISAARANGAPADRIISEWFRTRRFAGSSDRRAVRELVYGAVRRCGEVPLCGRAAMLTCAKDDPALSALFDGSTHAPAPIGEGERYARPGIAPGWLEKLLEYRPETEGELLGWAFCLAQISRKSGLRGVDLSELQTAEVAKLLRSIKVPEAWPRIVEEVVRDADDERSKVFGEALPIGLRLTGG